MLARHALPYSFFWLSTFLRVSLLCARSMAAALLLHVQATYDCVVFRTHTCVSGRLCSVELYCLTEACMIESDATPGRACTVVQRFQDWAFKLQLTVRVLSRPASVCLDCFVCYMYFVFCFSCFVFDCVQLITQRPTYSDIAAQCR